MYKIKFALEKCLLSTASAALGAIIASKYINSKARASSMLVTVRDENVSFLLSKTLLFLLPSSN